MQETKKASSLWTQAFVSLRQSLPTFGLLTGSIIFWEVLMHIVLFQHISWRAIYVALFSVVFGMAFTLLTGCFKRTGQMITLWVTLSALFIFYGAQLIYYKIFSGVISVYLIQLGGTALTNFFKETMYCIFVNLWLLLIMAIPLVICGIMLHKKWIKTQRCAWRCRIVQATACVLLHFICVLSLPLGGTKAYTVYDIYHNVNTISDTSVAYLGFLTTLRLELQSVVGSYFGGSNTKLDGVVILDPSDLEDVFGPTDPTQPGGTKPTLPTQPGGSDVPDYDTEGAHMIEIDFDALIAQAQKEGNDSLETLHKYIAAQMPTYENEYTGMFEGKNLIYLVCESFSPVVISPELTPTLYKLYNEGIKFTNFYSSFKNVTTNGEYAACLGMFPDLSRSKSDASFTASIDNYLPYALGNIFREQAGVNSYGYHNFFGDYYDRDKTHPNMGYACKFMDAGMTFSDDWPSSDLEMMQQSVGDYINEDRFHAYYMTFSGHYQYSFRNNPMCIRNEEAVKDLDYCEEVRAYIACHLELEKALTYLMEQLEMAGKLEDTVIVLTTDHYPYGLTNRQYNELTDEHKNVAFGIYENAFICWSYGMEDPIVVDTPCCTVDILPTLLNLFGFEYDSRLLIGQDVLDPNAQHIAMLFSGSFITDKVMFNSTTGEVTYLVDKDTLPENYVDIVTQVVRNRFAISTAILDYDYYRLIYQPDENE